MNKEEFLDKWLRHAVAKPIIRIVDKHFYWLTPPKLLKQIRKEFGEFFDPCPYPRPEGFNGLEVEWGATNYVNPPFQKVIENGKRIGFSDWIRKALQEQRKGKTSLLVYPQFSWFHLLLTAKAEMRSLGEVKWLAPDGTVKKRSVPIVMFILRGKKLITHKLFERKTMTYAEQSKASEKRGDEHMIYEMMNVSQYEDGSVLECQMMSTYTAAQIASGIVVRCAASPQTTKLVNKDLVRNAKAAIKHGKTKNRAPLVNW